MTEHNPFVQASKRLHPFVGHVLVLAVSVAGLGLGLWFMAAAMRNGTILGLVVGGMLVAHAIYWLLALTDVVLWTVGVVGFR